MTDQAGLLRKGRAIRAHVEHPGADPAETAIARVRLDRFLAKHNLTLDDLDLGWTPRRGGRTAPTATSADWGMPTKPRVPIVVHRMEGFTPVGAKWRAWCRCNYGTTPRTTRDRAYTALTEPSAGHRLDPAVCVLCDTDYYGADWMAIRDRHLWVLTDPFTGDEFMTCRDIQACVARSKI